MEYLIVIQKTLPLPGSTVANLSSYSGNEIQLIFSSFDEAQRIADRITAYNFIEKNTNIYIAVITFTDCKCSRKIVDILYLKKLFPTNVICNGTNTPDTLVGISFSVAGNESHTVILDGNIPNNDPFGLNISKYPDNGSIVLNSFNLTYTSIDTGSTLTDEIQYDIVNLRTGCSSQGTINININ